VCDKSIGDVSGHDGSNDSTNFKTAHKHATYTHSQQTVSNLIILHVFYQKVS